MKGFLKFLALVVLLVPAWIAFLSMTGDAKEKQQASAGPLVALDQAVRGAWNGGWVWGATAMQPQASSDAWTVEGLATAPEPDGAADAVAFTAAMHSTCLPLSDAACWAVDRLDVPSAGAAPAGTATASQVAAPDTAPDTAQDTAPDTAPDTARDTVSGERLSIVQEQLRSLDLDPGPSDGVFGQQTRQAVAAYIEQAGGGKSDDPTALALVDLEVKGRLARGARHHAEGDYHAALRDYAKVLELDPDNARAHFNRGLAYQEMGVLDLAIKEYGVTLDNEDNHVMAYHSRGNAYFEKGDYWRGFVNHTNGFGAKYGGDGYLKFKQAVSDTWTKMEPGVETLVDWAGNAWEVTWEKVQTYV